MINATVRMAASVRPAISSVLAAPRVCPMPSRVVIARFQDKPSAQAPVDQLIKADHDKVRELFSMYEKTTAPEQKQMVAYNIIRELSMHSSKEEDTVYPVMTETFGKEVGDKELAEHKQLKIKLQKLGGMKISDDESSFDKQVQACKTAFIAHAKDEEENEVPELLKASGVDPIKLGEQFEHAADQAVTRPHPNAPDKFPVNVIAKKVQAPVDAVADAIRFNGQKPEDTIQPV